MNKVVICNGWYRTGSTLAFNVVRLLLKQASMQYEKFGLADILNQCGPIWEANETVLNPPPRWLIEKHHYFIPSRLVPWVRVICTTRPVLSAASSYIVTRPDLERADPAVAKVTLDEVMASLQTLVSREQYHKSRDDTLVIPYELLFRQLDAVVVRIASFLGVPASLATVEAICERLNVGRVARETAAQPRDSTDAVTEFRGDHISATTGGDPDKWHLVVPELWAQKIVRRFRLDTKLLDVYDAAETSPRTPDRAGGGEAQ